MTREQAIQALREVLGNVSLQSADPMSRVAAEIRGAKDEVLARYQPMFAPENVYKLSSEDFCSFLLFRNNRHWDSVHRQGGAMTADMPKLRQALTVLLDENVDIRSRLDQLRPASGEPMVKGLGRAVITAILQVMYPDKYGVWNNTAESGMKQLDLWPQMPRGASFGERYVVLNPVLHETARELGIDLWTLDMLWWRIQPHMPAGANGEAATATTETEDVTEESAAPGVFGLERYLQEFLLDNWQNLENLRRWELLEEDGETVGSYYDTGEVGQIDLLAKRRSGKEWLVIELKKDRTSDATVGQLLRYMGWVRRKLANGGDVQGLIICRDVDRRLQYALDGVQNVRCMTYKINFALESAPKLELP